MPPDHPEISCTGPTVLHFLSFRRAVEKRIRGFILLLKIMRALGGSAPFWRDERCAPIQRRKLLQPFVDFGLLAKLSHTSTLNKSDPFKLFKMLIKIHKFDAYNCRFSRLSQPFCKNSQA